MASGLEISGNAGRLRHGLVIAGVLTLAGLLLLIAGGGVVRDHELLALGIFLLAAVMATLAYRQSRAGPDLSVRDEGLWVAEWRQTIPWGALEDSYIGGSRLRPLLVLKLKNPDAFLSRLDEAERSRLTRSPHVRLPELRVPASAAGDQLLPLRDLIQNKLRDRAS